MQSMKKAMLLSGIVAVAVLTLVSCSSTPETTTTTIFSGGSGGEPEIETWQLRHFSRYMLASG